MGWVTSISVAPSTTYFYKLSKVRKCSADAAVVGTEAAQETQALTQCSKIYCTVLELIT